MTGEGTFYICPICFQVCETKRECHLHQHAHRMVECDPGSFGDERRKPIYDRYGNLVSRAPRWYLEATRRIRGK
jgi:hypothetical protein